MWPQDHLVSLLLVLLHHVRLLAAVLNILIYLLHPGRGFTDIQDFRIANAFCHSIPEHKIQRDLITRYHQNFRACAKLNSYLNTKLLSNQTFIEFQ